MSNYFQFYKLNLEEQRELIGEAITFENREYLVVELDEFTTQAFGYGYPVTLLGVYSHRWYPEEPIHLSVFLPSIDDGSFRADFNPSASINLSSLTQMIYDWANRTEYKYINVHALEDYCRFLGAYNIDWS